MLIQFTVGNFLSFKDKVTLDMTAEGLKENPDFLHIPYIYNPKISLLKSVVIYGFNAFGKSNLLKAYKAYREILLTSFSISNNSNKFNVTPFLLNTSSIHEPTYFESVFIINKTKYRYGFEIDKERVLSEWLFYAEAGVRENTLFFRLQQEFSEISKSWNKTSNNRIEQSKIFTRSNNLFLTVLLSQENIPRVEEIASWFKGNIILNGNYGLTINDGAAQIYSQEEYRSIILKFIDNADLGFKSIFDNVSTLVEQKRIHSDMVETMFGVEMKNFDLYTQHQVLDKHYSFVKMQRFPLEKSESSGSIKYFIVASFLSYAIKKGQLIWIDELDASLHAQLLIFILNIFNSEKNNTSGSQLLFTTHNTVFLDNNLRRDQIWFVDKNERGESSLHKGHTPETPIRINKSIETEYREGKTKRGGSKKISKNDLPSLFDGDHIEK